MAATVTELRPPTVRRNANQRALAAWAATLPDVAADCRDLGHMWKSHGRVWWDQKDRCYRTENQCARECGVSRVRLIEANGDMRSQSYKYPHDEVGNNTYLMPKGHGGWSADARAEVRLSALTRQMTQKGRRRA